MIKLKKKTKFEKKIFKNLRMLEFHVNKKSSISKVNHTEESYCTGFFFRVFRGRLLSYRF